MRVIDSDKIINAIADACVEINCNLSKEVYDAIKYSLKKEKGKYAKEVLKVIIRNSEIAKKKMLPICQDTGSCIFFVEIGEEVKISNNLKEIINEGVRRGYKAGYLRNSIVDPISRKNTDDNTPAIIYTDIVKGDKLVINFLVKGAGSENMSSIKMLNPADGIPGIKKFVIDTIKEAAGNPCPPIFVGIGIGGTQDYCSILAKKALLRGINQRNKNKELANLEVELRDSINELGIGPLGFSGNVTCINVAIETFPCHTASLPICVNICCHVMRHKKIII